MEISEKNCHASKQVSLGCLPTLQTAAACMRTSQAWQGPALFPSKQAIFHLSHRGGIYVFEWNSQVTTANWLRPSRAP